MLLSGGGVILMPKDASVDALCHRGMVSGGGGGAAVTKPDVIRINVSIIRNATAMSPLATVQVVADSIDFARDFLTFLSSDVITTVLISCLHLKLKKQ